MLFFTLFVKVYKINLKVEPRGKINPFYGV